MAVNENNGVDKAFTGKWRLAPSTDNDGTVNTLGGGVVLPKYTSDQIAALIGNEEGQVLYNSDTHKAECWNGSAWKVLAQE